MAFDSTRPLTRTSDGYVAGICEGLGRHLEVEPMIIRVAWLLAVLFAGTGILMYLVLWWVLPTADNVPVQPNESQMRESFPPRRAQVDRKILGVCGGLARYWNLDPSVVRLGALALATLSFGVFALAYLVAAVFMGSNSNHSHPVQL